MTFDADGDWHMVGSRADASRKNRCVPRIATLPGDAGNSEVFVPTSGWSSRSTTSRVHGRASDPSRRRQPHRVRSMADDRALRLSRRRQEETAGRARQADAGPDGPRSGSEGAARPHSGMTDTATSPRAFQSPCGGQRPWRRQLDRAVRAAGPDPALRGARDMGRRSPLDATFRWHDERWPVARGRALAERVVRLYVRAIGACVCRRSARVGRGRHVHDRRQAAAVTKPCPPNATRARPPTLHRQRAGIKGAATPLPRHAVPDEEPGPGATPSPPHTASTAGRVSTKPTCSIIADHSPRRARSQPFRRRLTKQFHTS